LNRVEQELCHGTNKLKSLTFSSAREPSIGPRRINDDCKTVPRRNSLGGTEDASKPHAKIWIFSRFDYDEEKAGTKNET
jgi:hypothetical protein